LTEGVVKPSVDQVKNSTRVTATKGVSSNLDSLLSEENNDENEVGYIHHGDDDQDGLEFPTSLIVVNGNSSTAPEATVIQKTVGLQNSSTNELCESNGSSISYSLESRSVPGADDSNSPLSSMMTDTDILNQEDPSEVATLTDSIEIKNSSESSSLSNEAKEVANDKGLLPLPKEAKLRVDTSLPPLPLAEIDVGSSLDEKISSKSNITDSQDRRLWVGQTSVEHMPAEELSRVVLSSRLRKKSNRMRRRHVSRMSDTSDSEILEFLEFYGLQKLEIFRSLNISILDFRLKELQFFDYLEKYLVIYRITKLQSYNAIRTL